MLYEVITLGTAVTLDTRSFMLAAMLIFFASSVALFFLHRLRPAEKGPGWWTLGNACSCLGLLLLAFRSYNFV